MIYWSEDRKLVEREFTRMGFDKDSRWRISDINKDFELCNTYPRFIVIPSTFKDEDLESVAKFRYFRRVPTAVWRHVKNGCFIVRSSQPTVGWFGWFRNDHDESLVQSYVSNTMPIESERNHVDKISATNCKHNNDCVDNLNVDQCDQKTLVDDDQRQQQPATTKYIDLDLETQENHASDKQNASSPRQPAQLELINYDSTNNATNNQQPTTGQNLKLNSDQNNHNNNLQDVTKVLIGANGKTIRLDPNPNEESEDKTLITSSSTSTSAPSLQYPMTSEETPNGNGVSNPLDNSISSVIEDNVVNANATSTSKMLIIDARSYTAAMANRAKGGGCECSEYYLRCEVQFMNLANIHSIRKSFHAIRSVCEAYSEQSNNWVSFLDNSRWLHHISGLLKSALLVVDTIDLEEKSILIHCSDGWDRTPQIVALAEIMLDPHYRTFEGFRTLIQREWLDFGHKFADRCGSNPCNEDPNERCPVFLQWLDCVQQLLVQYPKHFEFNSSYLDKLNRHTYSNVFGTFSYNSTQERILSRINDKFLSLWSYFDSSIRRFKNDKYVESDEVLRPSFKVRDLHFWKEVYLPPMRNQTPYMPIAATNIDNKKLYDSLYIDGLTRTVCK